jgi:uncharacterized protein involved in exopolysaccharide biosynthesis
MAQGVMGSGAMTAGRGGVQPPEMNVFEYLRILYKYRWMVFVVCTLAAVGTGLLCYFSRPRYTAVTSVVPPLEMLQGRTGLGLGLLSGGEAALLRNLMDTSNVTDTYVGILQSRAVADAVVERFDLTHVYDVGGSRSRARERLERHTDISVSEEEIIQIRVVDYDRQRAAGLANAYVEELDRQNKRLSAGQAASKRAFLETRLKEVEDKLSQIDTLRSQDARIQEMLYEMLTREYEVAKIEEARSLPTIQVLDPAVPPERRNARGTVRKAGLAAVIALVCTMFLAFGREYAAEYRRHGVLSSSVALREPPPGDRAAPGAGPDGEGSSHAEGQTPSSERRTGAVEMAGPR